MPLPRVDSSELTLNPLHKVVHDYSLGLQMEMTWTGAPILLVEDNEPSVYFTTLFFESLGYPCKVARNGHEAVSMASSMDFSVILMDVQMPGLDGYQATRKIREMEKEKNLAPIHIIGMTAHALTGDREQCLSSGMDDYIPKPIHLDRLQQKIDAIFAAIAKSK